MEDNLTVFNNNQSLNLLESCELRSPFEWARLILEIILVFTIVAGNSLVIISISVVKVLRQPRNYLILSLAMADLLVGLVVLPLKIIMQEACGFLKQRSLYCYIWLTFDVMCCAASVLGLCIISLDRYIAITHPLYYKTTATARKAYSAIAGTWIFSFVLTIPYWATADIFLEKSTGKVNYSTCVYHQNAWLHIYIVSALLLPVSSLTFVSGSLCLVLAKQRSRVRGKRIAPTVCSISEALKERKGDVMIGIVVGVFHICWLPYMLLVLIRTGHQIAGIHLVVDTWVVEMALWLLYFNSSLNPFIYTMFNQDFRFAFKELICIRGSSINSKVRHEAYSKQVGSSFAPSSTSS